MKDAAHAPAADESATRGVPPPPGPPWAGAPPTSPSTATEYAAYTGVVITYAPPPQRRPVWNLYKTTAKHS